VTIYVSKKHLQQVAQTNLATIFLRLQISRLRFWPLKMSYSVKSTSVLNIYVKHQFIQEVIVKTHRHIHILNQLLYMNQCFAAAGRRIWNSLPDELWKCDSIKQLKGVLKTLFFPVMGYGTLWLLSGSAVQKYSYLLIY